MERTEKRSNKVNIFLSSSAHLVTDTYTSFIIGLIPVLAFKLGLSLFLVGILTSVNFIANSLTQPLFGYLSDKYGMRYHYIFGPLVASVFISLLGISPNYLILLVFLFLGNLGVAAIHPPSAAAANYFGGKRKGFSNSLISFGGTIGFSVGSLFVIIIVNNLGLRFTPLAAIPGIIMALIMVKFAPAIITKRKKTDLSLFKKFRNLKKAKLAMLSLLLFASYSRDVTLLTLLTFLPLYFTEKGVALVDFGYIIMAYALAGGIGGLLAGYYSDRIAKKTIVIQAGILISVPLIYLVFKVPMSVSITLLVLAGFFLISSLPMCTRVAQDIFPKNISLVSSLALGGSAGSAAATVILIGKIADNIGMVRTINYILILPVVASLLLSLFPVIKSKYKV